MWSRVVRAQLAYAALLMSGAAVDAEESGAAGTEAPCDLHEDFKQPQWRLACDTAITQEADAGQRAKFLQARAYVAIEQYRFEDALADLNGALAAYPDCADCLHERAYLNSELGEYTAATADLDREIALQPKRAAAWRERAFARTFSGDLAGAYQDRVRSNELEPSSTARRARGDAALWLGRFDDATADYSQAEKLANDAGDDAARAAAAAKLEEVALWRASAGDKKSARRCVTQNLAGTDPKVKQLIGDCTQAFLQAKDGPAKTEALTWRSSLWSLYDAGDFDRATLDSRIAVGLDPGNHELYVNLGFNYLQTKHSWAARREFDRAIALNRSFLALAGRAQARENLDDPDGAFADAKASYEIKPNQAALWVLGDLVYEKGDREAARKFYLGAYKLGSRDDRLIARLKELGVDDPAKAALE
jgi:tetratricopeptide (TPR) repeat protein